MSGKPASTAHLRAAHPLAWAFAALAATLALPGCDIKASTASRATLTYTEDARASYNQAMESFNAKEWEDARALFSELRRLFAYSRYARLAEIRLADIEFAQEKYPEAIAAYREFVQGHRTDRDVEYAKYRIAKALFLDIDDTFFLPPAEERDQATTLEAYKEVRGFLRDYPRSRYRADVNYMYDVVTQRLVRHELYVARFYLREDTFDAAVARVDYALRAFPGSGLDAEALVLKGETLLKMKKRDEARAIFQRVIDEHEGPFAKVAKEFLEELGGSRAPVKAKPAPRPARPAEKLDWEEAPPVEKAPPVEAPPGATAPAPSGTAPAETPAPPAEATP